MPLSERNRGELDRKNFFFFCCSSCLLILACHLTNTTKGDSNWYFYWTTKKVSSVFGYVIMQKSTSHLRFFFATQGHIWRCWFFDVVTLEVVPNWRKNFICFGDLLSIWTKYYLKDPPVNAHCPSSGGLFLFLFYWNSKKFVERFQKLLWNFPRRYFKTIFKVIQSPILRSFITFNGNGLS